MTVTPYSYREYTGNGSNKNFQVPFPYLLKAHVKVYSGLSLATGTYTSLLVDGVDYAWTSATNVQLTVAPAVGMKITVKRETPTDDLLTQWQDGSTLVAEDLLTSDKQNLYAVQEEQDLLDVGVALSVSASSAATAATAAANTATSTANTALTTANAASATAATSLSASQTALANSQTAVNNAASAVTTSQTAASNAATALSTSQTASTNAATAVSTSNTAAANAATALSTANTSLTNSQTASQNAATALTNSQTSLTQSAAAVTTANNSNATAASASSVAASASTAAASATTTANTANSKADQAIAAVSSSINYTLVTNVAGIPASPANDTYVEVGNSTGIESFTPLAGKPAGFVGDSGLSVRMRYTTAGATWNWQNYYPNNAETRYLKLSGGTLSGNVTAPALIPSGSTAPSLGLYAPSAGSVAISTSGAQRLVVDASGNVGINNGVPATAIDALNATGACQLRVVRSGQADVRLIADTGYGGVFVANAHPLLFRTDNQERLRITSAGLVGVGTSAVTGSNSQAEIAGGSATELKVSAVAANNANFRGVRFGITGDNQNYSGVRFQPNSGELRTEVGFAGWGGFQTFYTNGLERLRVDSSGRVGIGTTAPQANLEVSATEASITVGATAPGASGAAGSGWFKMRDNTNSYDVAAIRGLSTTPGNNGSLIFYSATGGSLNERARLLSEGYFRFDAPSGQPGVIFRINSSEVSRIDSSGRLLVGTSTSASTGDSQFAKLQVQGNTFSATGNAILNLQRGQAAAAFGANNTLGAILFSDNTGGEFARIDCQSDASSATSDYPGRLLFSTCSDNSAAPSERVRISSTGAIGLSGANYGTSGQVLTSSGSGAAPTWKPAGASIGLAIALG